MPRGLRLPTIYPARGYMGSRGLMAYGFDVVDLYRHAADSVAQVLDGAKPGDIPYYQSTKFELVINVRGAKAIGLTVPAALLLRADEVIE